MKANVDETKTVCCTMPIFSKKISEFFLYRLYIDFNL